MIATTYEKEPSSAPLSNSEEPESGNPAPLREGDWERILAIIAYMYIDKEIPEITS